LLSENPAVETAGRLYRATVLRCLPDLEVLDNQAVTPDEVEDAVKTGLILEHPDQAVQVVARRVERVPSPEPVPAYYPERESPPPQVVQRRSQYEYGDESPPPYRHSQNHGPSSSPEYSYGQSNGNKSPEIGGSPVSNGNAASGQRTPPTCAPADDSGISGSQSPAASASPGSASARRTSGSPVYEYYQNSRENGSPRRQSADYSVDYRNYENYYEEQQNHRQSAVAIIPTQRHAPMPMPPSSQRSKPRTKTSNLLSAVLCLIPELDWASLEVIELAVRRRMDEIHN